LSQCASCREVVSLSAPQPEIAAVVAAGASGWSSWAVLRWGALAACVVLVGAMVTLHQKQQAAQLAARVATPLVETQVPAQNNATVKNGASLQLPGVQPRTAVATKPIASQIRNEAPPAPAGGNFGVDLSPLEMADARAQLADMVPGRAKDASAELQAAPAQKTSESPLATKRMMAATESSSEHGNALISANLVPRWTLSADGTLQRSLDSGRTWQTISVTNRTVFRALAANGLEIWVGGSGGALFHSSDAGQRWTQIRPMGDGQILTDDIIGVEFTDDLHGKLTTAGQEVWITADRGQSWQRR
jgi:hypothetical protein